MPCSSLARQHRFVSHHLSPLLDHALSRSAVTRTSVPYESHADYHAEYQSHKVVKVGHDMMMDDMFKTFRYY